MGRSSARPLYLAEEPPGDEPHLHIASDGRGRVHHLEMAGEGPNGVGSSVAFSARRPQIMSTDDVIMSILSILNSAGQKRTHE